MTDADVILLIGPAGYGKTTTLTQWVGIESAPVAWLSLRRDESSAKNLLRHLAASLGRVGLIADEDVAHFQSIEAQGPTIEGTQYLVELLGRVGQPVVMVIDSVEVLKSRAAIDVLAELVLCLEGVARLALASRSTPKIGLSALRASGRLLEVNDEQLAFSVEELTELTAGLGLDADVAIDIMEATEGWPAAAFLTAVAGNNKNLGRAPNMIETQRHLNEFVRSDIIPHISTGRRRFLTSMSHLEQMSGALCDAISGGSNSQRVLESLESDTHLVHHLDHDNSWFAMNPVLSAALRTEMERNDPDGFRAVHTEAAAWYGANGMEREAIAHALKAGDTVAFARLMERLIKSHYATGQVAEVLMWMDWLEENVALEEYPGLAAIGALVHLQEGNISETERWLDMASRGQADNDARAVIHLVRAAGIRSGVEQMVRDIDTALEAGGPGSRWMPAILLTKGLAHVMNGDTDLAEASFVEAAKIGSENQSWPTVILALGQRALIAMRRKDWDLAADLCDRAVALIDEYALDGYQSSGLPLIAAARCARRNNDIRKALKLLARATVVRPLLSAAIPGESVQILLEMARTQVELSDIAGARVLIREAEDIVLQRPDLGVLPSELDSVRESLATLGPGIVRLPTLTKAELRLLPFLATHMSFPEIGEQLFVSRHTVKSQATSIYRKLGSSTRSEAVAKSHEIGLLTR
ncbi:MAG: LuxR C-terminal-related transcriptional regulator [Acidimicrobiia bacterium]